MNSAEFPRLYEKEFRILKRGKHEVQKAKANDKGGESYCKNLHQNQCSQDDDYKAKPLTFSLQLNKCPLLRDWVDSRKPVFFDFGDDPLSFQGPVLWRLEPRSPKREVHLSPVLKTSFLDKYRKGLPLKGIDYSVELRAMYVALLQQAPRSGFQRYLARQERKRRRF
jgi:hypothetical protein